MRRLFAGLAAAALCLSLAACAAAGVPAVPLTPEAYLAENCLQLDLAAATPDLAAAVDALPEDTVFYLAGEAHGLDKSYAMRRGMLKALHERRGVNVLVCEYGMGAAYLLDRYLATGEEALLQSFISAAQGSLACNGDELEFWHWARAYNEEQPPESRLHVVGVDVEHQMGLAVKALALVGDPEVPAPKELEAVLAPDTALNFTGAAAFVAALEAAMQEKAEEYTAFFAQDWSLAQQLADNLTRTIAYLDPAGNGNDPLSLRDAAMMENFCFWQRQYPDEKFFGQFGGAHVSRAAAADYREDTFAMQLEAQGSPVAGRVYTLQYVYYGASIQSPALDDFDYTYLQPAGEDKVFFLDKAGSPFLDEQLLYDETFCAVPDAAFTHALVLLTGSKRSPRL